VAEDGHIVSVTHGVAETPLQERASRDAYPIPTGIRIAANVLSGSVTLGDPVLRHDPLDALPFALKMIYSFKARPHRAWADVQVDATLDRGADRAALPLRGAGVAALTFLDSLPVK